MVTSPLLVCLPESPEEPESVGGDDGLLLLSRRRDPFVDRVLGSRAASGLPAPMNLSFFIGFTRFLGSFLRAPR